MEDWGIERSRSGCCVLDWGSWTYFPLSSTHKNRSTARDIAPIYFSCRYCRVCNGSEKKKKCSSMIPLKKGKVEFLTAGLSDGTLQWWRKIIKRWFKNSQIPAGTAALWRAGQKSSARRQLPLRTGERQAGARPRNLSCPSAVHGFCFPWRKPTSHHAAQHSWRVSWVRSHQQEICTARVKGAASPGVGRVPLGHPWIPVLRYSFLK